MGEDDGRINAGSFANLLDQSFGVGFDFGDAVLLKKSSQGDHGRPKDAEVAVDDDLRLVPPGFSRGEAPDDVSTLAQVSERSIVCRKRVESFEPNG